MGYVVEGARVDDCSMSWNRHVVQSSRFSFFPFPTCALPQVQDLRVQTLEERILELQADVSSKQVVSFFPDSVQG